MHRDADLLPVHHGNLVALLVQVSNQRMRLPEVIRRDAEIDLARGI